MNRTASRWYLMGALFFIVLFLFAEKSSAVEEITNLKMTKTTLVATVNLDGAKVISQDGQNLKLGFDISNRIGIQPEVKYGVEIFSPDGKELAYRKVFDELLYIGENEKIHKEITFSAPEYLHGEFRVNIISRNAEGMMFGFVSAGMVNFSGTGKYIKIDLNSCALSVSGDNSSYKLLQGVDVSSDENMKVKCSVHSYLDAKTEAAPVIRTFFRSPFGRMVAEEKIDAVQFDGSTGREFEIPVPKLNAPQVYDAEIYLVDDNEDIISNSVFVHYVVRGNNGVIQNATLDKSAYKNGDLASLSLFWTGRADDFPGARQIISESEKNFVRVSVVDSKGGKCADLFKAQLENNSLQGEDAIRIEMKSDCLEGRFIVQLTDKNGNVLDEKMIGFNGAEKISTEGDVSVGKSKGWSLGRFLPYVVAMLALIIGITLIIIFRRKKTGTMTSIFWIIIFLGLLSFGEGAKADTFVLNFTGYWDGHSGSGTATFTASMTHNDSRSYCPFEYIEFYGTGELSACLNTADSIFMDARDINPSYNGEYKDVFSSRMSNYGAGMVSFRVENNIGNYTAHALGYVSLMGMAQPDPYEMSHPMPYSVVDCSPHQGKCGVAAGKSFTVRADAEAAGLCSVGTLKQNSFVGTATGFSWQCNGTNGGLVSPVCSANRTPVDVAFRFGDSSSVTRNISVGTNFQLVWRSNGATVCRVVSQRSDDSVWVDVASPNWTSTPTRENRYQTSDRVPVYAASLTSGKKYQYGIRCFNTEAGTYTPWKFLEVSYGSVARCTGTVCDTNVSKSCEKENPSIDTDWYYVSSCTEAACQCECKDGYCLKDGKCEPDTLSNFSWQEFPGVDCTGKCGLTYGVEPACVANSSCGGTVTAPNGCDPATKPATPSENCTEGCDSANWREVEP